MLGGISETVLALSHFSELRNMKSHHKSRTAFSPSVDGVALEDRVVLNAGVRAHLAAAVLAARPNASAPAALTRSQLFQSYRGQLRAASNQLTQYVNSRIANSYANGIPTSSQLADLRQEVAGAVDATNFRISSQLALLPGATNRLVGQVQNGQLGNSTRSLVNRLDRILTTPRLVRQSAALGRAIDQAINQNAALNTAATANFLRTSPIFAQAVDSTTGQRIPLSRFMAQQVLNQFSNSMGLLASSFPTVADAALFNNGVFITNPAAQQAFASQFSNAVFLAATQLANNLDVFPNNLAVFPGSGTSVIEPVNTALFGSNPAVSTAFPSLFSTLESLPINTSVDFFNGADLAFQDAFQTAAASLGGFLNLLPPMAVFALPTSHFATVFSPVFSTFGNGFNTGFTGFSAAPINVAAPFVTGFNGLVGTNFNTIGFTSPVFSGFGLEPETVFI